MIYKFEIRGLNPIPKERPRAARNNHHYTPERTRTYEKTVGLLIGNQAKRQGINIIKDMGDAKLGIIVHYIRKSKHPVDTDNLTKSLKDALEGVLWKNDRTVSGDCAYVSYDGKNPGIILTVMPYEEWLNRTNVEHYSGKARATRRSSVEIIY